MGSENRSASPVKVSSLPRVSKLPGASGPQVVPHSARPVSRSTNHPMQPMGLTSPVKLSGGVNRQQPQARRTSGIIPPSSYATKTPGQIPRLTSPSKAAIVSKDPTRILPAPTSLGLSTKHYGRPTTPSSSTLLTSSTMQSSISPTSPPYNAHMTPQPRKVSRPSLADRTKQSLAQLPGTPASDRRRSGIFTQISPPHTSSMAPPARPASSMGVLRRSATNESSTSKCGQRPPSPLKRSVISTPVGGRASISRPTAAAGRRSMSAQLPRPPTRPPSAAGTTLRSAAPSTIKSLRAPVTKGTGRNAPNPVPAVKSRNLSQSTGLAAESYDQEDDSPLSPSSRPLRQHVCDPSDSSSSFRQAVERAKETAKNARSRFAALQTDVFADPFKQTFLDPGHHALRQRLKTALTQGRLNISDLDLEAIPELVLRMYDADSIEESKISWSETVDLTWFNAADNKLASLSEDAFPDVNPEDAMHDDSLKASIFAGIESLDLRGNQLLSLPHGLVHLRRLTTINLARNQIGNAAFDVLSKLSTLKKLILTGNHISGFLPQAIRELTSLETLDVSQNRILSIPECIRELTNLRQLNLAGNQLTGLPMDALEGLPIVELDVSSNALVGALFPFGVTGLPMVQELNVSNNSLASLAFCDSVALPSIRILKISNNRMVSLPDMSGWSELVTLAAGGNKLTAIPHGFSSLRRIRLADFTSNDITRLDERIALMDSLESLIVSANPLIDRKFLTMSADSIKRDLRSRLEPDTASHRTSDSFIDEGVDMRSPVESPSPFKVSANGALDLSQQSLVDEDGDGLRSLLGMHDIKELQLGRNKFTFIPYELSLAQNLKSLDMSMCELASPLVAEELNLPCLQELRLNGNKITALDSLIDNLNAPYLRRLDLSQNRLSGDLPILRQSFPHLIELSAIDNKIESISAEALKGLHTVVLARNSITQLPAEIGLLWFEGLRGLDVMGNAFRVPNQATMQKGTEAVLSWLRGRIPGYAGDDETF